MKKLLVAGLALATFAAPVVASAAQVWDPAEGEFVEAPAATSAAPVQADQDRYTRTIRVWDPAEGEFATLQVGDVSATALATNDAPLAARQMKRVWDPAEGEFMMVPAN